MTLSEMINATLSSEDWISGFRVARTVGADLVMVHEILDKLVKLGQLESRNKWRGVETNSFPTRQYKKLRIGS